MATGSGRETGATDSGACTGTAGGAAGGADTGAGTGSTTGAGAAPTGATHCGGSVMAGAAAAGGTTGSGATEASAGKAAGGGGGGGASRVSCSSPKPGASASGSDPLSFPLSLPVPNSGLFSHSMAVAANPLLAGAATTGLSLSVSASVPACWPWASDGGAASAGESLPPGGDFFLKKLNINNLLTSDEPQRQRHAEAVCLSQSHGPRCFRNSSRCDAALTPILCFNPRPTESGDQSGKGPNLFLFSLSP